MHKGNIGAARPKVAGVRTSESVYGMSIPIVFGMTRVSTRVVSASNFRKIKTGKKAGGTKAKGGGSPNYAADLVYLLAHYPLQTALGQWANATDYYSTRVAFVTATVVAGGPTGFYISLAGLIPQGDSHLFWVSAVRRNDLSYSETFTDFGDPQGSRSFSGTRGRVLENSAFRNSLYPGTRAADVFTWPGHGGATTVDLQGNIDAFTAGGQIQVALHYRDTTHGGNGSPLGKFNQSFLSPLVEQGHTFNDCVGVDAPATNLGSSGLAPKFDYEVIGHLPYGGLIKDAVGTVHIDCNPADIVFDLLYSGQYEGTTYLGSTTAMYHGLNVALTSNLSVFFDVDLSLMRDYCRAWQLYCSVYMDAQKSASEWFKELFEIANCAPVFSGKTLKAIPYDYQSYAGPDGSYLSPWTAGPIYTIPVTDFLGDGPPVIVNRERQTDASNVLPISFTDRANQYHPNQIAAPCSGEIGNYRTRRASARNLEMIHSADVALRVGMSEVRSLAIQDRVSYRFKLDQRYLLTEPMDLVGVTMTLTGTPISVRITKVTENDRYELDCEGDPFVYGLCSPSTASGNPQLVTALIDIPAASIPWDPSLVLNFPYAFDIASGTPTPVIAVSGVAPGTVVTCRRIVPQPAGLSPPGNNASFYGGPDGIESYNISPGGGFPGPPGDSDEAGWFSANGGTTTYTLPQHPFGADATAGGGPKGHGTPTSPPPAGTIWDIWADRVVGAWTDSSGNVMGLVWGGDSFTTTCPSGASQLQLGYNRNVFNLPFGAWRYAVSYSSGYVAPDTGTGIAQVNAPYIFQPVAILASGHEPEVWIAVTDSDSNYGGCQVYVSKNGGTDYEPAVDSTGAHVMLNGNSGKGAIYSATFPVTVDPDITANAFVDLTESAATLSSQSAADSDRFLNLLLIDGGDVNTPYELIAPSGVTLQGGSKYRLDATGAGNQIRRGVFGTPIVSHVVGKTVVVLNDNVAKVAIEPSMVGTVIYFKFLPINKFGNANLALADLTAYSFTPSASMIAYDILVNGH